MTQRSSQTYAQTFSDNMLSAIFGFRTFLKLWYSVDDNIISCAFMLYLIDHLLDLYIVLSLSKFSVKVVHPKINVTSYPFCICKYITLLCCLIADGINDNIQLAVLNILGALYFFIFNLLKSAEQLDIDAIKKNKMTVSHYKHYYSNFVKPCKHEDITFSEECVFCFDTMDETVDLCKLNCKHVFHSSCFSEYIDSCATSQKKVSCVVCRKNVDE
jgi:hypothetical protein